MKWYLSLPSSLVSSTHPVKQVFANMELLGWYTTGDVPTAEDTHFHEQVCLVVRYRGRRRERGKKEEEEEREERGGGREGRKRRRERGKEEEEGLAYDLSFHCFVADVCRQWEQSAAEAEPHCSDKPGELLGTKVSAACLFALLSLPQPQLPVNIYESLIEIVDGQVAGYLFCVKQQLSWATSHCILSSLSPVFFPSTIPLSPLLPVCSPRSFSRMCHIHLQLKKRRELEWTILHAHPWLAWHKTRQASSMCNKRLQVISSSGL